MKWLHFSDLHFNPNKDGTDTTYLRDRMIDFLKGKQIKVDKIFFTGDFRDASQQKDTDENAENAVKYIIAVAESVGVTDVTNILLVPGNHDLNRDYPERQTYIETNKRIYTTGNGTIANLDALIDAFSFYKRILKYVYNEDEANNLFENIFKINPHKSSLYNNYNILQMNTELLAGELVSSNGKQKVNDENSLIAGSKYVINSLLSMQNRKNPTIVMAHRGLDQLSPIERRKLLNIFRDYNVCLYVCGHSHDLWCDETYEIPQVTVGCIKQVDGVKAGFSIGEFDESKNIITINAYSWDNDCWKEYPHFCRGDYKLVLDLSDKVYIQNDDFKNKIRIVIDGIVRDFRCKVDHIEFDVEHTTFMSVGTGKLICTVKNNTYSSLITYNHKFILSNAVWCVIGVNNTANGVTTLTCKRELKGYHDDFENGIASKNLISNFVIELLAPIKNIALNQEIALEAMLFKDKELLRNIDLVWESSDEDVISIKNKTLVGVSIGNATIKVTWANDKDIFYTFNLYVVEKANESVIYRLYKKNYNQEEKFYKNFDAYQDRVIIYGVDKFINGNLVNNTEAYDFSFEPITCRSTFEIKEITDTYIKILIQKSLSSKCTLKAINRKTGDVLREELCFKALF